MPTPRNFLATGSNMSLKDVIDDVFLSSSVTEQGKLQIENENVNFYKENVAKCSSQYSAKDTIIAANITTALYLRNKYGIDNLVIPNISGSTDLDLIIQLQTTVNNLQTNVSGLQNVVGTLQNNFNNLQNTVNALQNQLNGVSQSVVEVSESIQTQSLNMPNWRATGGWVSNEKSGYLSLDFESTEGWVLETMIVADNSTISGIQHIIGRASEDGKQMDGVILVDSSSLLELVRNTDTITTPNSIPHDGRTKVGIRIVNFPGDMSIAIDGEKVAVTESIYSDIDSVKGRMFAMAMQKHPSPLSCTGIKFYYIRLYSGGNKLIADLWPAFDKVKNVQCMFDYVTKQYVLPVEGKFKVSSEVINAW